MRLSLRAPLFSAIFFQNWGAERVAVVKGGAKRASSRHLFCSVPAPPGAERFTHYQFQLVAGQPMQFLGKHRHAFAPGARHLCDVGTPEEALGPKCIVSLSQIDMHSRKRISLARVMRHTR